MLAPLIFVSTGTLVPATPSFKKVPRFIKAPLFVPHKLGVGPSPDRFLADAAYGPLKDLRRCWVEPLSWLGLDHRANSVLAAKAKLRQMLAVYPDRKVIVVGQSQGGLVVPEIVLDAEFTHHIAACVTAGAPFRGSPATKSKLLGWATCFPGVSQMEPGHPSLSHLSGRIKRSWPKEVPAIIVGSPNDELVPMKSAFGVEFPSGTDVRKYWIDHQPPEGDAEMRHLQADAGSSHILMCRRPSLIGLIGDLRTELTFTEDVTEISEAA